MKRTLTVREGTTSNSWVRYAIFMLAFSFRISPVSGVMEPVMICSCVVLPAPFTPAGDNRFWALVSTSSGSLTSKFATEIRQGEFHLLRWIITLLSQPAFNRKYCTVCVPTYKSHSLPALHIPGDVFQHLLVFERL